MTKLGSLWVYVFKVACFYPELPRLFQGRAGIGQLTPSVGLFTLSQLSSNPDMLCCYWRSYWQVKCLQRYQNS